MRQFTGCICLTLASVIVTVTVEPVFARGGGGGHMGGGHFAGAPRFAGSGFHGGPGSHSASYHSASWGYPHYYGWGYPYYGYGLGLGVGLGYGIGATYAYPGYGYAYPPTTSVVYTTPPAPAASGTIVTTSGVANEESAAAAPPTEFVQRGFMAFKSGDYESAVYAWRHAVVDEPKNSVIVLELAQALFATGKYDEAAGATQSAMRQLPQDQWGTVASRFKELYGDAHDYTKQLQAMEKALKANPKNPALRFLAGYHYGYLGFHKQSVEQLDKAIQLEPRDEWSRKLRDLMKGKLAKVDAPLPEPPPPSPEPTSTSTWTTTR